MLRSTFDLPVDAATPAAARRIAALMLRQWDVPDSGIDEATLVVSELVTNAVVHGQADEVVSVSVDVDPTQARVRVAVVDGNPSVPQQRSSPGEAESGRGLAIVAALATEWGVEPLDQGKRVYVELPLATSRCA